MTKGVLGAEGESLAFPGSISLQLALISLGGLGKLFQEGPDFFFLQKSAHKGKTQ